MACLCTKLLHGNKRPHRKDEVVDEFIRCFCIEQAPHNLRRLGRVDLLHIALDVAQHVVAEEVVRQLRNHVKAITHIDQRPAHSRICSHLIEWVIDCIKMSTENPQSNCLPGNVKHTLSNEVSAFLLRSASTDSAP